MNVRQLIEELQKYDPESLVCMRYEVEGERVCPWVMGVESSSQKFTYSLDNQYRVATAPVLVLNTFGKEEGIGLSNFIYFSRKDDPIVESPSDAHIDGQYYSVENYSECLKDGSTIAPKFLDLKHKIDSWVSDIKKGSKNEG